MFSKYLSKLSRFFDRLRYAILPAFLSKKRYFLPIVNRVGVSIPEFLILIGVIAGTTIFCITGRNMGSESSGSLADLAWIPLMLTIFYRNLMTLIFGISVERSMLWHGLFALVATALGLWHGWIAIFVDKEEGGLGWKNSFTGNSENKTEFWTGSFATGFMILSVLTSFYPIRKFIKRIWVWSHHIFPLAAIAAAVIHGSATPGIMAGLFVLDRCFGYIIQAHWEYRRTHSKAMAEIDGSFVKLFFPKDSMHYQPGQYMSICIPSVSWFEWHTFTIASSPRDSNVAFLIKPDGYWTRKLHRKVRERSFNENHATQINIWVHGPIGSIALDWMNSNKYQVFVLIGGGVGVTPLISFYRHLAHLNHDGKPLAKVLLVYSTRSTQDAMAVLKIDQKSTSAIENGQTRYSDAFEAGIFVTKAQSTPTPSYDPSLGIGSTVKWHYERPDLPEIFRGIANMSISHGFKRVGVLTCGPSTMTRNVIKCSRRASNSHVTFDLHVEHFV